MDDSQDKPKWQKFEEFVASLQSSSTPDAVVKLDDKIKGKSGVVRQIDVSVRYRLGQFDLLIIIDCKDWKTRVDINDVGSFIDVVEDVEANKGAIVCNAGFTTGAKKRATEKGIDLLLAVDAENMDWPAYFAFPALCEFRHLKRFSFRLRDMTRKPFAVPPVDPRYMPIFNRDGVFNDILINLFMRSWNAGKLPLELGEHKNIPFIEGESFVRTKGILYGPIEIRVTYDVGRKLYSGEVPVLKGTGFANALTGSFTTKHLEIELDAAEIEAKWRKLDSEEELATKPAFSFCACDCYPLIKCNLPNRCESQQ